MNCPECNAPIIHWRELYKFSDCSWFHQHIVGIYYVIYQRLSQTHTSIWIYDNPFTQHGDANLLLKIEDEWMQLTESRINAMLLLK